VSEARGMGADFVFGVVQAVDGEKDPRYDGSEGRRGGGGKGV
jgi:hypothetical protein